SDRVRVLLLCMLSVMLNLTARYILKVSACVLTDGMFGRCQSVPVKEVYTYDVSPSVVQRFRTLLEKLSNRGLTWEDDTTQQVLSKELSKLRRIPYRPQQNGAAYNTDSRSDVSPVSPSVAPWRCLTVPPWFKNCSEAVSRRYFRQRFIEKVLKNVGRQHVDVDGLTPQDLDQLSRLIADALQVVDRDQGLNRGLARVRPGPRDLSGELREREEEEEQVARDEEEEKLLESAPTLKPQEITPVVVLFVVYSFSLYFLPFPFVSVLHSPSPPTCLLFIAVSGLQTDEGLHLMEILARRAKIQMTDFAELSYVFLLFYLSVTRQQENTECSLLPAVLMLFVLGSQINQIPTKYSQAESTKFLVLTVVSILCIVGVLLASTVVYCLRHRSHHKIKEKLTNLGTDTTSDATATYQELCRQRMAVKPPTERPEPISSRINSVSSQFSDGGQAVSPSARSSISSWSEEPAHSNMDISTGHMILSYMEDHLKNKDRLEKEWEALCAYQAEPNACTIGMKDGNAKKNRSTAVVAYDHSRITLKVENSQGNSDYINASPIMDHDPRNPAYIATQGPLPSTVADFWQMVWENGCVVIVMLTPLVESGVKQCYHYWPDEGSNLYHIYEVNLVSEHIWCDDFLVRSFYLKNMQTNETRTVTQFHFLTWLNQNVPETSRTLLDFRRKVNKCYRGRSCPIIVHCSDGSGRSGTYILVDMVLNKMAKGAKEIDIAATLEHLRDQRPGMVQTKDQFEFALTAVAEEVNAILKALPQ
uniref:Receptor-type tyrosine-protein phosphatase N2 n=1 Tax=Dicentrarchus labrax TaxID=13489 RepID=A0A8P4KFI1_DICLA